MIGRSISRPDAVAKVTGQAAFAGDLARPGMLHLKLLFAGRPHARIRSLDISRAAAAPGVAAVLTARDVPVNRRGLLLADQPVLCDEVVRFEGDPLAAVVAESPRQAAAAAGLINVQYEDLPLIDSVEKALRPGAPVLHAECTGNVAATIRLRKGDPAAVQQEAHLICEQEYYTPMQEHAFLELEAGLAYVDEQNRLVIHAAAQSVHDDRVQIARALALPLERVRVICGPVGGAFGGREDITIQIVLALAAWITGRPVRACWGRGESIRGHPKRHAMSIRHRWGAAGDGRILFAEVDVLADAGAYMCTSSSVLESFLAQCLGPYEVPHVRLDGRAIYTNNIPGGAFRGYGAPQAAFAAELQIARIAEQLGIDPVTIRQKNCLRAGSCLPTQSTVRAEPNLPRLIETCARESGWIRTGTGWSTPAPGRGPRRRRGFGLAVGMKAVGYGYGFPEGSEAKIILYGGALIDRAELYSAAVDVGQGSHAALIQIAAHVLSLPIEKIRLVASDTALCRDAGAAAASRLTLFAGNAVKLAAEQALQAWQEECRPAVGEAHWEAPATTPPDPETGACIDNISYSFGVQGVEVEVDLETGQVDLKRVVAVHDPGRAVNPAQVQGQIEGAVVQAMGWALLEDFVVQQGRIQSDRLSTYLVPTVRDIPASIQTILIETPDPIGPFGVRGVGEIAFVPLAPAIVCAVHDAAGIWFSRLPLKNEDVLRRLCPDIFTFTR